MLYITNALMVVGKSLASNKFGRLEYLLGLMLCIIGISLTVAAAPSDLDPSFGTGGKVISAPNGSPTFTTSGMVLQPDGKIVVAGNRLESSVYTGTIVARYNPDGSLDKTFGNDGWNSVVFGTTTEFTAAVAIQPDGKIVTGATLRTFMNGFFFHEWGIARFNADGTPDMTFDGDGKLIVNFDIPLSSAYQETLSEIKVGSDGKIVAVGHAIFSGFNTRYVLARINADGSMDSTFGTNGKKGDTGGAPSNSDVINDMVILPDGKIVVVGSWDTPHDASASVVIKYNTDGVREWTYNLFATGFPLSRDDDLNGIAVQPDGKLVAVGRASGKVVALRLNPDGTRDNSFISAPGMPNGQAMSVAVRINGKIVATLESGTFSLVGFNADGSLDTGFGTGGFVNTSLSGGGDYTSEVLVQPDGKILVSGSSFFGTPTGAYISIARYRGEYVAPKPTPFDFDGDGKTDIGIFRPSNGQWWYIRSSDAQAAAAQFSLSTDKPVPGDYTGDSKTDIAHFRPETGEWFILRSENGSYFSYQFGLPGDIPAPADYDGDGKTDTATFRPSNQTWYIFLSGSGGFGILTFGLDGDRPVPADFDGDGKADIAVWRPSNGTWWIVRSSDLQSRGYGFGLGTDKPVPGDYTGDGKADIAVWRDATREWYFLRSEDGSYYSYPSGLPGDIPAPGDYDGDGKFDSAVFRPSTVTWYIDGSSAGSMITTFGLSGDTPVPSAFVP